MHKLTFSSKSDKCLVKENKDNTCVLLIQCYRDFRSLQNILMNFKDTVDNAASLNVSILGKVQLDELPKATRVIVINSLSISKCFHDGTGEGEREVVKLKTSK